MKLLFSRDSDFWPMPEEDQAEVHSPRSGDDLVRVIARAYQSPPQIIARLRELNKP